VKSTILTNNIGTDPEENRRILAIDDDENLLLQYQQIFSGEKRALVPSAKRLIETLSDGVKQANRTDPPPEEATDNDYLPYPLDCFLSGEDAVQAVRDTATVQLNYAVALIDIRMASGIGGLEAARQIRKIDQNIQIIFVTAYSDYTSDEIFQQISGAVLWFRKPFHSEELYQVVRNSCISWNQAHQLELLRQDLASRVDLQTERLNAKMQTASILQKNSLKRELRMGAMKRELRSLKAYQDLRLLLQGEPLTEPEPLNSTQEPVELLLVDDSTTVRTIYKHQLEEVGFHVQAAASIEEGFSLAQQQTFEVALIDFYMPGGNGDKLIHLLHEDPHTMYVLPLLFTNAGDEMTAVEAGAAYWMIKDQPAFLQKMMLVRDYVQKSRSQVAQQIAIDPQFQNRRVLLVDDEARNLELLSNILGVTIGGSALEVTEGLNQLFDKFGSTEIKGKSSTEEEQPPFEISIAKQGEQAIAQVREAQFSEQPFAIALIDMRMPPGIDGLETARQIRQISPQIDIVILTAYTDHTLEEMRSVLGSNFSYIKKPYTQEVLLQRVLEGCEKWKMVNEVNASHHALLNLAEDMEEENLLRQGAEQQLIEADKAKDQFLASMSHELRTPLTVIIGNCKFLAENEEDHEREQVIQSIGRAGRNQLALVNDILDMSKIRSGKFAIDEAPYNLAQMLLELEQMLSSRATDARLDFIVQSDFHEERQLLGDEQRITQILINLVSNAIKFTQEGQVAVTISHDTDNLFFKVKDSGIGMSLETQQRLFKQFEQADSSISHRFGGTGLGLFISGSLAEMMGGTINVESKEGVGSTFELMLPYRQSELVADDINHSSCPVNRYPLSGTVLIAEDILELQLLERRILEGMGITVIVVNNGEEAVDYVSKNSVDLILMDMQMPIMDGIEATTVLRQKGFTLPIIALSANVMKQQQELFITSGCDHFLSKPIDDEVLWQVLSHYLGEQQKPAKIESIVWRETHSVGHPDMDRQHREIAGLINELMERAQQNQALFSREQILEMLPRISDAYANHLQNEEYLLASVGYPELNRHKQEHELYLSKLATLFATEVNKSSICVMVETLVGWWSEHVLHSDLAYKDLVKAAPSYIRNLQKPKQHAKRHALIDDELMALFDESSKKNRRELTAFVEQQAWGSAREVAHRVKGTALTFGFPELAEVARKAQVAIDNGKLEQIPTLCHMLIEELQNV
jgi:hemerythrin-like metal-binding protein